MDRRVQRSGVGGGLYKRNDANKFAETRGKHEKLRAEKIMRDTSRNMVKWASE